MGANTNEEQLYVARLVSGEVYWLRDRRILSGHDYIVTEKEMLHLSEHAVIVVPTPCYDEQYDAPEDRTTTRDMFTFRELGENEELTDVDDTDPSRRSDADREEQRRRALAKVRAPGTGRAFTGGGSRASGASERTGRL